MCGVREGFSGLKVVIGVGFCVGVRRLGFIILDAGLFMGLIFSQYPGPQIGHNILARGMSGFEYSTQGDGLQFGPNSGIQWTLGHSVPQGLSQFCETRP